MWGFRGKNVWRKHDMCNANEYSKNNIISKHFRADTLASKADAVRCKLEDVKLISGSI